jgi:hypothetical protein
LTYAKSEDTERFAQAIRSGTYAPEPGPKGEWLKTWARWFFGPNGPRIV